VNPENRELVLIRGLPGSGKSTLAKAMTGFAHFEADMYHTDINGVYKFDWRNIEASHDWCESEVFTALLKCHKVVVSNVFMLKRQIQPYVDIADIMHITLRIIEAKGNYKSVHGVPEKTLEKMKRNWEHIPEGEYNGSR